MANIKIDTRFGELEVDPSQVITFPRGIPGFEKNTRWKLFHEMNQDGGWLNGVVVYLQSLDEGDVSLPLTDPTLFGFNYDLVLTDSEVAELGLKDPGDILVMTTLSVKNAVQGAHPPALSDLYVNISAPILINVKSRIGMQKVLTARESRIGFHSI